MWETRPKTKQKRQYQYFFTIFIARWVPNLLYKQILIEGMAQLGGGDVGGIAELTI